MKNQKYLIILLSAALLLIAYRWIYTLPENADTPAAKSTIEDILTRTSVRTYTKQSVSAGMTDTLLRAAMAAPTARNLQPWKFIVIDKREILDSIAAGFNTMTMAGEAPLAIVMCGDLKLAMEGEGRDYWVQDVSAATENLLLAAHAMGLGAVWCGIYPVSDRVEKFSRLLALPENIVPMACVCIGYPAAQPTPKDKWKPENIHYNSWDGKR